MSLQEAWPHHWLPKCEIAVSEIEFLCHLLSASGCFHLLKHSADISAFPVPSDKPALQRFLGMLNFYWKFLLRAAGVLAPLTDTFRGPGNSLVWSLALDSAFCMQRSFSPQFLSLCILLLVLRSLWSKIQSHVHASVPAIPVPSRRFSYIHLDLVGPFPSSHGFTYLLTMIDRTA